MSAHDFSPEEDDDEPKGPRARIRMTVRTVVASLIVIIAVLVTCVVMVPADEAVVISRLGNPVRVITKPGLAFKWFYPIESTIPVKLQLQTSSTGLQDVGTRDNLRVLVQTYTAWRVPNDPEHILKYLRTLRNQPDEAAMQVRNFVSARMHTTASNFNFSDLVNPDPAAVHIDAFEQQLRGQVSPQLLQSYGIEVSQVGVERMTLPELTLAATVNRMAAEREIAAAQATAEGAKRAAQITSDAEVYATETVATARRQASQTIAGGEVAAARVYAGAYNANPGLYTTLRSLDTASKVMGPNTTVILRTDSAPFKVLSDGPSGAAPR